MLCVGRRGEWRMRASLFGVGSRNSRDRGSYVRRLFCGEVEGSRRGCDESF